MFVCRVRVYIRGIMRVLTPSPLCLGGSGDTGASIPGRVPIVRHGKHHHFGLDEDTLSRTIGVKVSIDRSRRSVKRRVGDQTGAWHSIE
jgi:hypothetical protein